MHKEALRRPGLERRVVTGTVATLAAIVWTHGGAGITRHLGPPEAPLAASALTVAAIVVALIATMTTRSRHGRILAAEFNNRGESFRAFYYKDGQKRAGYYDERLFIYGNERDLTCRLFGYHGLVGGESAFSLDHMFGF